MSLAFHFFKRDVRRASWLISLRFLLFAAEGILALSIHPAGEANIAASIGSVLLFPFLHVLVLAVLVPQLVHEDALVDSAAFWLTRPIGRGALLLAKMAGLGLIVLIPIVVNATVLVAFGLAPGELGLALVEILMNQLLYVVPIAVLASLTPNFVRFVAIAVATIVTLAVLWNLLPSGVRGGSAAGTFATAALANTQTSLASALLSVGGMLVLVHQYLSRRSRRSIVMATCLAVISVLVAKYWPWNLGRDEPLRLSTSFFDPAKTTLQITPSGINNPPYNGLFGGPVGKNIDGGFRLRGVPPELMVQVRSANPRLIAADGTELPTLGSVPTLPISEFDPPAISTIAAAIGGIPVYSATTSGSSTTFVTVDGDTFLRYKNAPVKLVDELDMVVSRYELTAELPLVRGSRYERGSVHGRIKGLVPRVDGVTIVVAESCVSSRFSHGFHGQAPDPRIRGDPVYLLVNRPRKEAALVNPMITRGTAYQFYLGGMIVQQSIELPFGGEGNSGAPTVDGQWLAGATLVRLERVPVAELRKTAEIELPKLGEPWESLRAPGSAASAVAPFVNHQSNAGIALGISHGGIITFDGKVVNTEQLAFLLARAHQADADATVTIASDEGVPLNQLTSVMDACREAGMNKLKLQSR